MTPERPMIRRPFEVFELTEEEVSQYRISGDRLNEILANPNTSIQNLKISSNHFGEFLFLTASRGVGPKQTHMTFWGLGYHEYRERWLHDEWFWYQTQPEWGGGNEPISLKEVQAHLTFRHDDLSPNFDKDTQSEIGQMFETLADMMDDDAALAEMQDMGLL